MKRFFRKLKWILQEACTNCGAPKAKINSYSDKYATCTVCNNVVRVEHK